MQWRSPSPTPPHVSALQRPPQGPLLLPYSPHSWRRSPGKQTPLLSHSPPCPHPSSHMTLSPPLLPGLPASCPVRDFKNYRSLLGNRDQRASRKSCWQVLIPQTRTEGIQEFTLGNRDQRVSRKNCQQVLIPRTNAAAAVDDWHIGSNGHAKKKAARQCSHRTRQQSLTKTKGACLALVKEGWRS